MSEIIKYVASFDDSKNVVESLLSKPFARELEEKTLNPQELTVDELVTAIHTAAYLEFPTKDLIEEFVWKTGEHETVHEKYFKNGEFIGTDIILRDVLKVNGYRGSMSSTKLCIRFRLVYIHECAKEGNLRMLKYAHSHGSKLDTLVSHCAAGYGQLKCLKYLHENGCVWNWETCYWAARRNHLECLKYAHEHGCPWDEKNLCDQAAHYGHLDCLKYLHENGCKLYIDSYTVAFRNGHVACCEYIKNQISEIS